MNVIMLSPGYPAEMAFFSQALAAAGATVIGVGDQPPPAVPHHARAAMTHYVHVGAPRRDWRATTTGDGMVIVRHPDLPKALEIAQRFAAELQLYAG